MLQISMQLLHMLFTKTTVVFAATIVQYVTLCAHRDINTPIQLCLTVANGHFLRYNII